MGQVLQSRYSQLRLSLQNLEILSLVRRELQREGFIKVFKVHIHPSCQSGDMPRLQRIITQLGSEIMTSESEPSSRLPLHAALRSETAA